MGRWSKHRNENTGKRTKAQNDDRVDAKQRRGSNFTRYGETTLKVVSYKTISSPTQNQCGPNDWPERKSMQKKCRQLMQELFFRNVDFERKDKVQRLQGVAHCSENFYLKRQKDNYLMINYFLSSNLHIFIISNYVQHVCPCVGICTKYFQCLTYLLSL